MGNVAVAITTTGSAGAATASVNTGRIDGTINGIFYNPVSMPATTDIVITEIGGLGRTILTLTNSNANKTVCPMFLTQDTTGANLTGVYVPFHVNSAINIAVAQADAGSITVTFNIIPD